MAKKKHGSQQKSLGQINCETYHTVVGSGFNWGSMAPLEQEAWEAAAQAVTGQEAVEEEKETDATH